MKILKSQIIIDNTPWGVSINRVAREMGFAVSYISRVKNNQVTVSEAQYNRIKQVIKNIKNTPLTRQVKWYINKLWKIKL